MFKIIPGAKVQLFSEPPPFAFRNIDRRFTLFIDQIPEQSTPDVDRVQIFMRTFAKNKKSSRHESLLEIIIP